MTPSSRLLDRYEPLLGTVVEIRIELDGTGRDDEADALSSSIADEMLRLQAILSSVDPASEFSRWCRGEVAEPSSELTTVLGLAASWQSVSIGRFNPAAGVLSARWSQAARDGIAPDDLELDRLAIDIAAPRWDVIDGTVVRLRDASDCTLNALAKGWIADRGIERADVDGLLLAAVNAGGDIAVRGTEALTVGIEDPFTPYDNAAPSTTIALRDAGLATSGRARKWFDVAGTRHSHVLDPRTGRPADGCASISVVAGTTADADAAATMLGVIPARDAIAEADAMGLACLAVDDEGVRHATASWHAIERFS